MRKHLYSLGQKVSFPLYGKWSLGWIGGCHKSTSQYIYAVFIPLRKYQEPYSTYHSLPGDILISPKLITKQFACVWCAERSLFLVENEFTL